MENKYFDKWEFRKALSLVNEHPYLAKEAFEEYLKHYPKDYQAYGSYASVLITIGNLEEAEKILNYVENKAKRDPKFDNIERINHLEFVILLDRLKLLSYLGRYDELYDLYNDYSYLIKKLDISSLELYCKKKLGILEELERASYPYIKRQIIDYRENDFLYTIGIHDYKRNEVLEKPNKHIFSSDFQVKEIISELKQYIPSSNRLYTQMFQDSYLFKYDGCGKADNRITNFFEVVCFHDTTDIITMFPTNKCYDLEFVDLNYLKKEKVEPIEKIKKISRVDRFNQKYKRN